jgi:hypothetical protein
MHDVLEVPAHNQAALRDCCDCNVQSVVCGFLGNDTCLDVLLLKQQGFLSKLRDFSSRFITREEITNSFGCRLYFRSA